MENKQSVQQHGDKQHHEPNSYFFSVIHKKCSWTNKYTENDPILYNYEGECIVLQLFLGLSYLIVFCKSDMPWQLFSQQVNRKICSVAKRTRQELYWKRWFTILLREKKNWLKKENWFHLSLTCVEVEQHLNAVFNSSANTAMFRIPHMAEQANTTVDEL